MTYGERPAGMPGVVLWQQVVDRSAARRTRILPDGCLDLIWDGGRLSVAGPDSTARCHESPPGSVYTALRLAGGTGPALLGVPADELRDRMPDLADLWPAAPARRLAERVASDPTGALAAWAAERSADSTVDPLGPPVLAWSRAGTPAAVMAARLGIGVRQLHRRCLPVFGYGPRRLTRILRLGPALDLVRAGVPFARVAADCGYADQAHLSREVRDLTGLSPRELVAEALLARAPAVAAGWRRPGQTVDSGANRSTGVPSGSRTTA